MRVFLGMVEISGCYRGLKQGFDELGVPCTFIDLSAHPFGYGGASNGWLVRAIRYAGHRRQLLQLRAMVRPFLWRVIRLMLMAVLFLAAVVRHKVFIFGYGSSFFAGWDLPVLKLLGKRVILQYHGSDARPPFMDGWATSERDDAAIGRCIAATARQKRRLCRMERWADAVIDIPPQALLREKSFIQWLRVGLACRPVDATAHDGGEANQANPESRQRGVRILHCPSNPRAKGSDLIRAMIQRLRDEGRPIDYVEVVNQPNAVVMDEMKRCDIVVDQMFADYGMPGLATEAAWLGKPVLIAGYAADLWKKWLPAENLPPTVYCHPDRAEAELRRLVDDREHRLAVGATMHTFVRTQWNPAQIAKRYLLIARRQAPSDWWYDPQDIAYTHGCCHSESAAQDLPARVIQVGGIEALCLSDKPRLEQAMRDFAGGVNPLAGQAL